MISYPRDRAISAQARATGIPAPILVRDLVRVVEVLNLKANGFFSRTSVLAGSMALRCFGSPRFTVYDADFSTSSATVHPQTAMKGLLDYHGDPSLDITAADLVPTGDDGTVWKSDPITYVPAFTGLVPNPRDRDFKADVSFRGLVEPGMERELLLPYSLDIWLTGPPIVTVMDPHEIMAEKILGWCADRHVKHYADLAYIAIVSNPASPAGACKIDIDYLKARDVLDAKLKIMARLQPGKYSKFPSIDPLVGVLAQVPTFEQSEWGRIRYLASAKATFTQDRIVKAVREIMVPRLRGAARR